MMIEADRHIPFEQVFNFRDLGGYPTSDGQAVRWRRLFRADGLNRLQPEEEATFGALGVATVVDLRTVTVYRFLVHRDHFIQTCSYCLARRSMRVRVQS